MKRFRFRLERLLRVRRMLERQARQALANAAAERARADARLQERRALRHRRLAGMTSLQDRGPVEPRAVLMQETDLRAIERRIDHAVEQLRETERIEAARVEELAEARRDLQVLEKLREKALAEYRAEAGREELAALDEHTSRRHAILAAAGREDDR